jgi:hypothetical protein
MKEYGWLAIHEADLEEIESLLENEESIDLTTIQEILDRVKKPSDDTQPLYLTPEEIAFLRRGVENCPRNIIGVFGTVCHMCKEKALCQSLTKRLGGTVE